MASARNDSLASTRKDSHALQGKQQVLNGRRVYFVGKGEKVVIVFHDIFGYEFWLTRLMCHELANAGYKVALPDLYNGDSWGLDQDMGKDFADLFVWLKKFPWHTKVKAETYELIEHMKNEGSTSFSCLGFCSGAYLSYHFCSDEMVKCGIGIHPSVQISDFVFAEKAEDLAAHVKCPQFLCTTNGDSPMYSKGGDVYEILDKKFGDRNLYKFFPGATHGFVSTEGVKDDDKKLEKEVKLAMADAILFLKSQYKQ